MHNVTFILKSVIVVVVLVEECFVYSYQEELQVWLMPDINHQ